MDGGWGGDSVSKVLALQRIDLREISRTHVKFLAWWGALAIPGLER